jgi:hypothetical protein
MGGWMKRLGSVVLALSIFVSPAPLLGSAITETKIDCGRLFKEFWEKLDREKFTNISGHQLASVTRLAVRAYDACQTRDEFEAKELFDRLRVKLF